MKDSCTFIILGSTGDLARKKLIPAIYKLYKNRRIKRFALVGVAKSGSAARILAAAKPFIKDIDKALWEKFKKSASFLQADFYDREKFDALERLVSGLERKRRLSGQRIFYLATLPEHFDVISSHLSSSGLARRGERRKRVVFEKPFGHDLKSARRLNKCLRKVFAEEQIYRIDHYLGKELVQNIAVVRFTNMILEPIWNRKYIDHVQVLLSEDFGVEGRGAFYDRYGALKDVVQNHLLQLVALCAMEAPRRLTARHIRDEKVKVLKAIKSADRSSLVLGQYRGYLKEKGVRRGSGTETFAALKLGISNPRWKGVPFYLLTGKALKSRFAEIYIAFKQPPCLLFEGVCEFQPNHLTIQVQPEEGLYAQLNAKAPAKMGITQVHLDFCHECVFGPNTPAAYENLLYDVIRGDQSAFIRSDEIEEAWRIIDKVERRKPKPVKYAKGSHPKEADVMIRRDGRYWHLKVK